MKKFEDIYSGPTFEIYNQFAWIVNIIYIWFLLGPGIPLLFPITLAGLIFNFYTEKGSMAYSYQQLPMYDSKMTQNAQQALSLDPVFTFPGSLVFVQLR